MEYLLAILAVLAVAVALLRFGSRRTTVFEFEKGIKYVKGRFVSVLDPGQYWYLPHNVSIQKVDTRPRFVSIPGQDLLSADGITLKLSLAACLQVIDPNVAINKVQNFQEACYLLLQIALREIVGGTNVDAILAARAEISNKLAELTEAKIEELGVRLVSVSIKDIMFPGKLKDTFAQVVSARQEGLAALERARGETAALRNLANAAKLIDDHPNLLQLRLFQTLSESSGNTIVFGMPLGAPFPIVKPGSAPSA